MSIRRAELILLSMLLVFVSCDRGSEALPDLPSAIRPVVNMTSVARLADHRRTHVAIEPAGGILATQETPDGHDTLLRIVPGQSPQPTALTSDALMTALGMPGGSGNIQSIVAVDNDRVWFYFLGLKDQHVVACLGEFAPKRNELRVLYGTDAVRAASGMGASFELGRGKLVLAGGKVWFWLRHSDAWALFKLDPADKSMPALGECRPFDSIHCDSVEIKLTRDEYDLAENLDGALLLQDLWMGNLWRIDNNGAAFVVNALAGLPKVMTPPAIDKRNRFLIFAAKAPLIAPRGVAIAAINGFQTRYPALLIFDGVGLSAIPREDLQPPAGVKVDDLVLQQMLRLPGDEAWVGYDSASGQILRLALGRKGNVKTEY